ncbi:TPA: helix-turn-helix domain-containing protein [Streptococcus suis]
METKNRLKELRKASNFSQKDFFENIVKTKLKLDVTLRTYQNWENPNNEIKSKPAQALADFFGVSVGYLLGYDNSDAIFWNALDKYGVGEQTEKEYLFELSEIESGREIFLKYFDKAMIKTITDKENKVLNLSKEDAINQVNHFFKALYHLTEIEIELLVYFKVLDIADQKIIVDLVHKLANRNKDN